MTVSHAATADRLDVDQPWRERAACTGRADVMDPPADKVKAARASGIDDRLWLEAKRVCWACPVLADCRAWVLSISGDDDWFGVCGGLTGAERQTARRRAGMARRPPGASAGHLAAANASRTVEADARYQRYLRLWRHLTTEQIAGRLGVSAASVRRYEQRRRREEGRT